MRKLALPSFAKVNWILKILGRRPDGYHEVLTLLQSIDLCDLLEFEVGEGEGFELGVKGSGLPADPSNLVWKAAQALLPFVRCPCRVGIRLHKRIPLGAGLGGGSGNAAVTLLALNQLWSCRLGGEELGLIGGALGSDVPFFLLGGLALGEGRGERLTPLSEPGLNASLVLIYPGLRISAAQAYGLGNWGLYETPQRLTSERAASKIQRFRRAAGDGGGPWALLENDFEDSLFKHFPILAQVGGILRECGCRATLLSGSGSTVMGIAEPQQLKEIAAAAVRRGVGEVLTADTLQREEYWRRLREGGLVQGE